MSERASPPVVGVKRIEALNGNDWDLRLANFPKASFFHSSAWLRVLHSTYGFEPHYLSVDGDEPGLLPILEIDSWLTGRRGSSLPFTDECAVVTQSSTCSERLIHAAKQLCASRHWKYWDYRGGRSTWAAATPSVTYLHHTLSLTRDTHALFSRFESSTRTAIRKAEKAGVQIDFSQTQAAVREFYDLVGITRRRQGLPPQPSAFFDNIHEHVIKPGLGSIVLARSDNRPTAGAMFFHSGPKAIYKFGASNEVFQDLRSNNLVMWRAIDHFARAGFFELDFGRTSLANLGLRRFKRAWGTQESIIEYVRWSAHHGFLREADRTSGWHTRLFKTIPHSLSRLLGAVAYRHIA